MNDDDDDVSFNASLVVVLCELHDFDEFLWYPMVKTTWSYVQYQCVMDRHANATSKPQVNNAMLPRIKCSRSALVELRCHSGWLDKIDQT